MFVYNLAIRWKKFAFLACALLFVWPSASQAELANLDLSAKIYTKWLYRNNDSQGVLWLGHPALKDNYSGDNGVGAEVEINIKGKISRYVTSGVRLKSRFGAIWHNWWENGDLTDIPTNSGESLGMNHAEYMKLRGYWFRVQPKASWVNFIHIGSSDFSQFNAWTIGKIRYIDRDNGKGIFIDGGSKDSFHYHIGIIPLPKLWTGPGWSTGLGDTALAQPFYGQDYAYALRLDASPADWISLHSVTTAVLDWEANRFDPDAVGTKNPKGEKDGAVALANRYFHLSTTLEAKLEFSDNINSNILFGYTDNRINADYATNRIPEGGVYNLAWGERRGVALRGRLMMDFERESDDDDATEVRFSVKAEGFYIGPDYNAAFGARRESDVLLTHGFLGAGQLPTLNIANEFMDFDEGWFESIIGWTGGTVLLELGISTFKATLEGTFITYATNNPVNPSTGELYPRDVDKIYPSFPGFHTGITDTDFYNNINRQDFGRDTRSVYRRYQDRMTAIVRLAMHYPLSAGNSGKAVKLFGSFKYIRDMDGRQKLRKDDNYVGDLFFAQVQAGYALTDWLNAEVGIKVNHWRENRVYGTDEQGYSGFITNKYKPYLRIRVNFGGLKLYYYLEYVHRDLLRDRHISNPADRLLGDRHWRVWRSKATAEVAW